ncbi:hypothetical protein GCE9029_01441 [Grimontia celer]|uniref:DUF4468 domain-containing protein n=1 Tax=Grimontia celer TaxID=1796497 RepID=A0A128EYY7_9GAMM|nr:hypothetical protein [Grimontia celer]CZF79404.1 hypothetical protein GCE9029_01441 [Grimontia celer]
MKALLYFLFFLLPFSAFSASHAVVLPPANHINVIDDFVEDELDKDSFYQHLDKDVPGTPIRFVTYVERVRTSGGFAAETTSGLLAASTLGLVPIVRNKDFKVVFRVIVNGKVITEYEYVKNVTDATSLYTLKDTELSDDLKVWVSDVLKQTTQKLKRDKALLDLIAEYKYYYGDY